MKTKNHSLEIVPKYQKRTAFYINIKLVIVVMAISFVGLLLTMPRGINIYDEGIIVVDAMRMMYGDIPHRDFYSNYGPAQYAIVAGLFEIFGLKIMVARIYGLAVEAAIVGMIFHILSRRVGTAMTVGAAIFACMWFFASPLVLYPIFPCILLALIGSNLLQTKSGRLPNYNRLLFAGICTGFATLFRYDVGFFLMIANLAALTLLTRIVLNDSIKVDAKYLIKAVLTYGFGISIIFLPVAAAFLLKAPLQTFLSDIVEYPTKYYAQMRSLPFPGLHMLMQHPSEAIVYLPYLSCGLAAFQIWRLVWSGQQPRTSHTDYKNVDREVAFLTIFGFLTFALFFKGLVRVSSIHMLMANIPALLVMASLVNSWWGAGSALKTIAALISLSLAIPTADGTYREIRADVTDVSRPFVGWFLGEMGLSAFVRSEPDGCTEIQKETAVTTPIDYLRVARYIASRTKPSERIFVGLDRHDKIFVNPVALYFVAGRMPATHWHHFDPGLQTRADIQLKMITDLKEDKTKWLILDSSFDGANEPNKSSISSHVKILDDYIKSNFRTVAGSGNVMILLANNVENYNHSERNIPIECIAESRK